ncbi:MAG: class I SAM-dependent methyltransferase [Burkholderiales bacterium]|nr:class I SAM-dependent methyltransferase [Burkholderiales bacterium]
MNIPPALRALFSQIAAFLLVAVLLNPALEHFGWNPPLLLLALIQGIFAAVFSMPQEKWWRPIQLCFAPLVVILLSFQISPYWFLLGFFLLTVFFWNVVTTRVPLFLTGSRVEEVLAQRLPEGEFEFVDLGSGFGGVITMLARNRPNGKYYGMEIAPLPYLIGKARCLNLANCRTDWGSFEKLDLSRFDFVYAFLSPVPMPKLFEKAKREMKPGSLFISNSFQVPGVEAGETVKIGRETLYFWQM